VYVIFNEPLNCLLIYTICWSRHIDYSTSGGGTGC